VNALPCQRDVALERAEELRAELRAIGALPE